MRIKISNNKIVLLILLGATMTALVLYFTLSEPGALYKEALLFQNTQLDSCKITKIEEDYVPGRPGIPYYEFSTDCSHSRFPIFLESEDDYLRSKFQIGALLTKSSNSRELTLIDNSGQYSLLIVDPAKLNSRSFDISIVVFFIGLAMLVVVLLPDAIIHKLVGWEKTQTNKR